jgi:Secretion system C-terminal sorting domain
MKKLFFFLLTLPLLAFSQPVSQTFNASGSWICPAGYTAVITVEAWGGGGGSSSTTSRQGGGGGGAYAQKTSFSVSEGTFVVTVGPGGNLSSGGGASSFDALVSAAGGGSSSTNTTSGAGGLASASIGDITFSGGTGGIPAGGTAGGGGGGGSATSLANGSNGSPSVAGIGGAGGTGEGAGGKGANTTGVNPAIAGTAPGGGGGGKASTTNITNAAGAPGRVIVTVVSFALPVELIKFSALTNKNKVNLAFTTASEKNNDFFAIERSNDGKNFRQIGEVKGNGTSTSIQNYTFTDETPANGRNFYRLKQVDFDGKFEYSSVQMVSLGRNNGIQLAPTQVEESMKITLDKALEVETTWEITNIEGRIVKSGTINAETTTQNIETYDLQAGQYFVRLLDNNQPLIAKFVKM